MINENNKSVYEHLKEQSLNSNSKDSNLKVQNIQCITLNSVKINKSNHINETLSKIDIFKNINEKDEKVRKS